MSADTFHKLKALGLSLEQIGSVLEIIEEREKPFLEADAARKANARDRVNKWRSKQPVTLQKHNGNVTATAHASASPAPDLENKQTNKEDKKTSRASHEAAFRAELASDLPDELLDGIIQVRRDKRGQVTGIAARLFRDDAATCGLSVHDAARACVTSSWITVKPHYFQSRAGPTGRKRNYADVAMDRMNGNGPKGIFSTDGDAQLVSPSSREPGPDDGHIRGGIAGRYITSGH